MATRPLDELVNILGFQYDPKGLDKFKKGAKTAAKVMAGASVAFVAGVAASVKMAISTAAAGDEYAKFGRRVGFSAEALQEFEGVADEQGVTAGEVNKSIEKLSLNLGMLKDGSGALKGALKDTNGELMEQLKLADGNEEAMLLMLDALRKIEDPARKAALAQAAFGKSGQKMIQIAELSAKEIDKLRKRKKEDGIITNEMAAASENLTSQWGQFKGLVTGLKIFFATQLIPTLGKMFESMNTWIRANRELVKEKIKEYVKKFIEALKSAVKILQNIIKKISSFTDLLGGAKNILIILTAALAAFIAVKIISFFASIIGGLIGIAVQAGITGAATNMAFAGIPALIALIIMGIGLLILNWEKVAWHLDFFIVTMQVAWEDFIEWFTDIWNGMPDFFKGIWDKIVKFFKKRIGGIKDEFNEMFGGLFEKLKKFFALLGRVKDKISGAAGKVGKFFGFGTDEKKTTGGMDGANALIQPSQIRESSILGANGAGMSTTNNSKKMNVNQDIKFTISGAENPQAVAAEVNQMLREASAGATNNSTTGTF